MATLTNLTKHVITPTKINKYGLATWGDTVASWGDEFVGWGQDSMTFTNRTRHDITPTNRTKH